MKIHQERDNNHNNHHQRESAPTRDDIDTDEMEKFFAIIRNFHQAKNRRKEELLRDRRDQVAKNHRPEFKRIKKSSITDTDDQDCFQKEHFAVEIGSGDQTSIMLNPPLKKMKCSGRRSSNRRLVEDEEEEEVENGLDLKLSL
ncbi:uncharacterized protein LOC124911896 [Impatiens glandulifera]|uniref:uncharacterized protein LOC124911896 n=1 Tax=Impatiens glandulifera TaxID=253017 RepID=UPI001FB0DB39|nr:uncharacterized protein LOC124911896 [Impatiens glandulifera]